MLIVAGHPRRRAADHAASYLAGCVSVVEQAHGMTGCLDFAITADLIDPGRVNVLERWESQKPRSKPSAAPAPATSKAQAMLSAAVAEYDVADVRPLLGE